VSRAPTSTTKMTGFLARVMGLSLRKESLRARLTISGSRRGRARESFLGACRGLCLGVPYGESFIGCRAVWRERGQWSSLRG